MHFVTHSKMVMVHVYISDTERMMGRSKSNYYVRRHGFQTICIPKLELCGMLVLALLANRIRTNLAIPPEHCHFWNDSTVALSCIAILPTQQETYISNRITEIQQLTQQANWCHINTRQNPADLISRGCLS